MSFLEDIKKMENDRESKEESVINEITDYFTDIFNSEKYEDYLKKRIAYQLDRSKKTLTLTIKYAWYSCSSKKVFECSDYEFATNDYCYKGIDFYDIQEKVCNRLSNILINKLQSLGLEIVSEIRNDSKGYYYKEITISW